LDGLRRDGETGFAGDGNTAAAGDDGLRQVDSLTAGGDV
jgi:hypothetical protein